MKARKKIELWVDETKMALFGIGLVLKKPKFAGVYAAAALCFAYVLTLFKDGTSTWGLLWSNIGFLDKVRLMFEVWGRVLANFTDWWGLVLMLLALLQGLAVALLVYGWHTKVRRKDQTAGLEAGGAGAALGFLALGCPACSTSLFMPLLSTTLGTGAAAGAAAIGWVLVVAAMALLLFGIRRLGYGVFISLTARRHRDAKG